MIFTGSFERVLERVLGVVLEASSLVSCGVQLRGKARGVRRTSSREAGLQSASRLQNSRLGISVIPGIPVPFRRAP